MRKKDKLVFGIGINDYEGSVNIDGKFIKSYKVWQSMLNRCYNEKFQERCPTYIGCSVADEWKYFSNFKKWFDTNYRGDLDNLGIRVELDKDLLIEGNKIYSSDNCVFLPNSVNSFLTNKQKNNTSGYIGVYWNKQKNKWEAHIRDGYGKLKYLGCFINLKDASLAYQHGRALRAMEIQEQMRDWGYSESVINKIK